MSVFKNRHVVVAALVAPVLALIAYFAMDFMFGEKPSAAVEGQSYPLAEKPGCRWDSGYCGLKNNDLELDMTFLRLADGRLELNLESTHPLEGVMLAVVDGEADIDSPEPMRPVGDDGLNWTAEITVTRPETQRLRLAAAAGGSVYYGDASTRFTLADGVAD